MTVTVLEEDEKAGKMKIEVNDLTLVNLLNENLWKENIDYAAYAKEHFYLSNPKLLVQSKDPRKSLIAAAEQVIKDAEDLKKKFQRIVK